MKTRDGIYALLILVLALEVWALLTGNPTISQVVWSLSKPVATAVAFAAGFVCGHLFWPKGSQPEAPGLRRRKDKRP